MNTIYLFIDSSFIFVNCNFSNVIDKPTNEIKDIAKWRFIQQFLAYLFSSIVTFELIINLFLLYIWKVDAEKV